MSKPNFIGWIKAKQYDVTVFDCNFLTSKSQIKNSYINKTEIIVGFLSLTKHTKDFQVL